MVVNAILADVSAGMQAESADGKVLGTIIGVGVHGAETFLEVTPTRSLAVWFRLSSPARCMYVPGHAISGVSGTRALLSMDAQHARGFTLRPSWFVGPRTANLQYW